MPLNYCSFYKKIRHYVCIIWLRSKIKTSFHFHLFLSNHFLVCFSLLLLTPKGFCWRKEPMQSFSWYREIKGPSQHRDHCRAPREIRRIIPISKSPLRESVSFLTSTEASKLKFYKYLNGIEFWPKQLLWAVLRALSVAGEPHLALTGPFRFLHLSTHLVPYSPELYF